MPRRARQTQLPLPGTVADTQVEAYEFIRQQLRTLQWVVKNPSLNTGGQVWTQNQCLADPYIKQVFALKHPENIVKISESLLWIIEAETTRNKLHQALDDAIHYYADRLNAQPGTYQAVFASGVAGNEASQYLVTTKMYLNGSWSTVTMNGQPATGLLSPEDIRTLLQQKTADIREFAPPQWLFLQAAETINELLHIGGINKNDRAKTIAALLLSVIDEPPNLDTSLPVLIAEINARSEAILRIKDKSEFAPFVKLLPPVNTTNHIKFRNALVKTIQELQNLNIRSAMNSNTDILGQFYEVFLKYGNGAKEIGIVLTPRHITRFAIEAIGMTDRDIVLDPACGTGGFLVAAFDYVHRNFSASQTKRFARHNIFGVEQESYIAVLGIVNMIFRGDGRHNIVEGNCFTTYLIPKSVKGHPSAEYAKSPVKEGNEPVTRILMNPPFALPNSTEKEYHFVSHMLSLMADGGLLFSLLPLNAMFGAHQEKIWRVNDLLSKHTLLAVITLPHQLFSPAAQKQVLAVIVKKGTPHPREQAIFWARIAHDGHLTVKSKRLPATELRPPREEKDDIPTILPALRNFIVNPNGTTINEPMLCKTAPIDFNDPLLELLPEAYLDSQMPSADELTHAIDAMVRETAAFLVKFGKENKVSDFNEAT